MFFTLSKAFGFFAWSSNIFMAIGLAGLILLCTRWTRLASWLVVTSLVLLAIAGYSPLGNVLIVPLEDRFPQWDPSRGPPDGLVVLGGVISPEVSAARNAISIEETPSASRSPRSSRGAIRTRGSWSAAAAARSFSTEASRRRLQKQSWWRLALTPCVSPSRASRAIPSKTLSIRAASPTRNPASGGYS